MSKTGSKLTQQLNETYKLDFYYLFSLQDKVIMPMKLNWDSDSNKKNTYKEEIIENYIT